ncbi:MAG: hypothetical protein V1850_02160 [Candidatus Bathyarchaeota archaeon]
MIDMSITSKLLTQEARYLLIQNNFLPIDLRDFLNVLAKNGYQLTTIRNLPSPPNRIAFSGEMARKQETIVITDSETGEIGVVSRSLEEARTSFGELIKLIKEEIGVDLTENVKNYQINVHYRLKTGNMPYKEIPKIENKEFINKFNEIIGQNLSSFSIRLAKKDSSAKKDNWVDIAIEPDVVYEDYYHIGVVYKNPSKDKTETFVKNLETNLMKLIELIEV